VIRDLPKQIADLEIELGTKFRNALAANNRQAAAAAIVETWNTYPDPKHKWAGSQSLLKDIANFYFEWKKYPEAEQWANEVFKCELLPHDAAPYILLGKIYLEAGREDLAGEQLVKAFELGGRRGFVGEDAKYLKFAQEQMKRKK
jgi:tetratricopeptide (TPR) repeat protein